MEIDPKNVCISAAVKVQKYRSRLTVWIITLSKVIRDKFNTWNHSKHANWLKAIKIKRIQKYTKLSSNNDIHLYCYSLTNGIIYISYS